MCGRLTLCDAKYGLELASPPSRLGGKRPIHGPLTCTPTPDLSLATGPRCRHALLCCRSTRLLSATCRVTTTSASRCLCCAELCRGSSCLKQLPINCRVSRSSASRCLRHGLPCACSSFRQLSATCQVSLASGCWRLSCALRLVAYCLRCPIACTTVVEGRSSDFEVILAMGFRSSSC